MVAIARIMLTVLNRMILTDRAYSDQRRTLFPSRFVRTRAFTPKQKNVGRRMNISAVISLDVITC